MTSRLSRHAIVCAVAWLLCSGLYFWTAAGNAALYSDRQNAWHHYEYLVDGFLAGHTRLSLAPPPELLALPDPYDPKANDRYRLGDASLYQGQYFLYFGPAPALLTMLPWKLLTGHHLPQWAACAMMAAAGLAALTLLLGEIRRNNFPKASPRLLFATIMVVGHVSWLPVILRRPAFWELPIITVAALFWWSIYCLWKFHSRSRSVAWAIAGGLFLALAPAARPNSALAVVLVALFFFLSDRGTTGRVSWLRRFGPVLVPLALSASALVAYNMVRFGAPLEFGQNYQLWGVDYRGQALFEVTRFGTNLFRYFFTLPEASDYFPFFHTAWSGPPPQGLLNHEDIIGLLVSSPAILLGVFAFVRGRHVVRKRYARAIGLTSAAAALGGVLLGAFVICSSGLCSRYLAELAAGWTVVTGIGCLALFSQPSSSYIDRVMRYLAGVACAWTFAGVWLCSFEFRGQIRSAPSAGYPLIAEVLNFPSLWMADYSDRQFGPVTLGIRLSEAFVPGDITVLSAGRPDLQNRLIIERPAPNRVRIRAAANDVTYLATPVLAHTDSLIRVQLHAPWLYPPPAHPYWRRIADPTERRRLQTTIKLTTEAGSVSGLTEQFYDAVKFDPAVETSRLGAAWVESLTRHPVPPR